MGHKDLEFLPSDKVCDVFLPESKQAIIIQGKTLTALSDNGLNSKGLFFKESVKSQGLTPIVLSFNSFNEYIFKEKDHNDAVKYLESLGVSNKLKGNNDFSVLDNFAKSRQEKAQKAAEEEQH